MFCYFYVIKELIYYNFQLAKFLASVLSRILVPWRCVWRAIMLSGLRGLFVPIGLPNWRQRAEFVQSEGLKPLAFPR